MDQKKCEFRVQEWRSRGILLPARGVSPIARKALQMVNDVSLKSPQQ
jgi:hypothetical protein